MNGMPRATTKGAMYRNTAMREALVNCRPTNRQPNSAANRAPASQPAGAVPPARQTGRPRHADQAMSSKAAPPDRIAACHNGGICASASLAATWLTPHSAQQATSSVTATVSRCSLRALIGVPSCCGYAPFGRPGVS